MDDEEIDKIADAILDKLVSRVTNWAVVAGALFLVIYGLSAAVGLWLCS